MHKSRGKKGRATLSERAAERTKTTPTPNAPDRTFRPIFSPFVAAEVTRL